MKNIFVLFAIYGTFLGVNSQRAPPGVNPQHYQYQQQPQYQQAAQQQYQAGQQHVPPQQQHVPPQQQQYQQQQQHQQQQQQHQQQQQQHQQQQQQQMPVQQQFQQGPVQHQVPLQQVPHQPQVPQQHQAAAPHAHHNQRQIFNAGDLSHEKEHIQEHMEVPIDTSKMSDQELQFHYFKMHDADNNNKLDGCELIKSLIHWHEQGSKEKQGEIEEKIFKDDELVNLIDPILNVDDGNKDGYIDYPEFIRAQQKAAGQKQEKQQQQQGNQ